jgi:Heterokaryon incompatibility protein (HET)
MTYQRVQEHVINDTMDPYRFQSLDGPDKIRILRLIGVTGGIIECTIDQISVSSGGYEALSYVWGSEERKFRAAVHDARNGGNLLGYIPLTANLNHALHDLWSAEQLPTKVFWIDQICIDQDGMEKSSQVELMGQIFENAERVITYVGRAGVEEADEEKEKLGINLLQRLDGHFEPNYHLLSEMVDLREALKRKSQLSVLNLPADIKERLENNGEELQWLVELGFGKWTSRMWMVQEQFLNENVLMLRGSRTLSWDTVAIISVLFFLGLLPVTPVFAFWRKHREAASYGPWEAANWVFWLWKMRKMRKTKNTFRKMTLLQNMMWCDRLECRDPRDRIFALLGICSDAAILRIAPDYSEDASVTSIFLRTSVSIIRHSSDLSCLVYACLWNNSSNHELPSWALYLPRPLESTATPIAFGVCSPHPPVLIDPLFSIRFDCSTLVVRGSILDQVSLSFRPLFYTSSFHHLGEWDETWTRGLIEWISAGTKILTDLGYTLNNAAAFCRALLADPTLSPAAQDTHSQIENDAFAYWCCLRSITRLAEARAVDFDLDVREEISQVDLVIESLAPLFNSNVSLRDNLTTKEEMLAMEMRQIINIRGRSLGVTKERRICNCMNEARQGDVIAALQGADRLYILRAVGDYYRIIGDAYVVGLMEGEAYAGIDPVIDREIMLV